MSKDHIEMEAIENYLMNRLNENERKQFEISTIIDASLAEKTEAQKGVYQLIRRFWRSHTRKSLELIYQQLLKDHSFVQQIG
jgi:hypothetical protein